MGSKFYHQHKNAVLQNRTFEKFDDWSHPSHRDLGEHLNYDDLSNMHIEEGPSRFDEETGELKYNEPPAPPRPLSYIALGNRIAEQAKMRGEKIDRTLIAELLIMSFATEIEYVAKELDVDSSYDGDLEEIAVHDDDVTADDLIRRNIRRFFRRRREVARRNGEIVGDRI